MTGSGKRGTFSASCSHDWLARAPTYHIARSSPCRYNISCMSMPLPMSRLKPYAVLSVLRGLPALSLVFLFLPAALMSSRGACSAGTLCYDRSHRLFLLSFRTSAPCVAPPLSFRFHNGIEVPHEFTASVMLTLLCDCPNLRHAPSPLYTHVAGPPLQ